MSLIEAERSRRIKATPSECYEAIADFESYPEWQTAVERVDVLERDPDGRGRLVEVHIDLKLRQVRYQLRYHHDPPGRLWWEFVEGDGVEHVEGEFLLKPSEDGSGTDATYRLGIDVGFNVPGVLARRLSGGAMARVIDDLADRVE